MSQAGSENNQLLGLLWIGSPLPPSGITLGKLLSLSEFAFLTCEYEKMETGIYVISASRECST